MSAYQPANHTELNVGHQKWARDGVKCQVMTVADSGMGKMANQALGKA